MSILYRIVVLIEYAKKQVLLKFLINAAVHLIYAHSSFVLSGFYVCITRSTLYMKCSLQLLEMNIMSLHQFIREMEVGEDSFIVSSFLVAHLMCWVDSLLR